MKRLKPAISYYGSKWRLAPRYPAPEHDMIVEPFAGGACYSLLHHTKDVLLCDLSEDVAGAWRYLIGASPDEILRLPLWPDGCEDLADLPCGADAKLLISWWLNKGGSTPCRTPSAWMREPAYASQFWGENIRKRLARICASVSHWRVVCASYVDLPEVCATWFIDPPYQGSAGARYPNGSGGIDYEHLAGWCHSRAGQAIVCEGSGADWLPFEPFATTKGTTRNSREVWWTNAEPRQATIV